MIPDATTIKSPDELFHLLLYVRHAIEAGRLRELPGEFSIAQIREGQPWPSDVIRIEFESIPSGTRYALQVEVYHGSGGSWKKVT